MKSNAEINSKIIELMDEVNGLQQEQNESVFTGAVSSLQEVINCKRHAISSLNWVLGK